MAAIVAAEDVVRSAVSTGVRVVGFTYGFVTAPVRAVIKSPIDFMSGPRVVRQAQLGVATAVSRGLTVLPSVRDGMTTLTVPAPGVQIAGMPIQRQLVMPAPLQQRAIDAILSPAAPAVAAGALVAGAIGVQQIRRVRRRRRQARIELLAATEYAYYVEAGTTYASPHPYLVPALESIPNEGDPELLASEAASQARQRAPVDEGVLRGSISYSVVHGVGGRPGDINLSYEGGQARATKVIEVSEAVSESEDGIRVRQLPVERVGERTRTGVAVVGVA